MYPISAKRSAERRKMTCLIFVKSFGANELLHQENYGILKENDTERKMTESVVVAVVAADGFPASCLAENPGEPHEITIFLALLH